MNEIKQNNIGVRQPAICSNCNAPIDNNDKYCQKCGMKTPELNVNEPNINFCSNCGIKVEAGTNFCQKCGQAVSKIHNNHVLTKQNCNIKASKKVLIIFLAIVLGISVIFTIIFSINSSNKNELHTALKSAEWISYKTGKKCSLKFNESIIYYDIYYDYIGKQNIATMNYEIVDSNTIKVRGKTIKVYLSDGGVRFSPTFISSNTNSYWLKS